MIHDVGFRKYISSRALENIDDMDFLNPPCAFSAAIGIGISIANHHNTNNNHHQHTKCVDDDDDDKQHNAGSGNPYHLCFLEHAMMDFLNPIVRHYVHVADSCCIHV